MLKVFIFLYLIINIFNNCLFAQDRVFNRTYQTNILPKNSIDIEYQTTSRLGRDNMFFHRLDQKLEFELGVIDNLQSSFYILSESVTSGTNDLKTENVNGFANAWKYKLSDPILDFIGSALYAELTVFPKEVELETKLILDKRIGDNVILAFNAVYEKEFEFEYKEGSTELEPESKLEFDLGFMHKITNNFSIGIEATNYNVISEDKGWEFSTMYAGPSINITGKKWFLNLGFMPQIGNLKGDKKYILDEHERIETRLIFSYNF
ncbi:MAG: hypothetical protein IPP08_00585 [Chlorobiota bacterium]|nr:MAG: hypothetical protein IPP08_00585 [Chlorobiota bacterium]